jgi:peptidoglycan/xylan/chitin deacetylase (PgdA/CDA1 family)
LQEREMTATFYVNPSRMDGLYMSVDELLTLQNNDFEIGSHGNSHLDFSYLSDSQIRDELQISKQVLQSWGLTANNFAYPDASRNDYTDSIVAEYYHSARYGYVGSYVMHFPITQFLLTGFPGETGDPTALSKLKSMVDQVYSANGWTIIVFHNVYPDANNSLDAISSADFASFLDYVQAKGVATFTVDQGLNLNAPPTPTPKP